MASFPKFRLADLGVQVLPVSLWPEGMTMVYGTEEHTLALDRIGILSTVQTSVYADHVEAKRDQIKAGEYLTVEIFPGNQKRWWILDGHHTLAAYFFLRQPVRISVHRGPGGRVSVPAPPRLYRR